MNVPYVNQVVQNRFPRTDVKTFPAPIGTNMEWGDGVEKIVRVVKTLGETTAVIRVPVMDYMMVWSDDALSEWVCDVVAGHIKDLERQYLDDIE